MTSGRYYCLAVSLSPDSDRILIVTDTVEELLLFSFVSHTLLFCCHYVNYFLHCQKLCASFTTLNHIRDYVIMTSSSDPSSVE